VLLNQKCVYYYNCYKTVDECKLCELITHTEVDVDISTALQNLLYASSMKRGPWNTVDPIPALDDVLDPADTILSPANSCLYFTECMGEICPCHLIDATVVVPQIKTYVKTKMKGGDSNG